VGEGRTERPRPTERRVTVSEAAEVLGISPKAVRMRIKRGTLPSERRADRVYVWLVPERTRAPTAEQTPDHTAELIATLREQLQAERQAHAEARRIIAGLVERLPPQLEAPSEPRERPERGAREPERVGAGSDTGGASGARPSEGPQAIPPRRGLWSRLFGG
jgi:hypothetical protein